MSMGMFVIVLLVSLLTWALAEVFDFEERGGRGGWILGGLWVLLAVGCGVWFWAVR